VSGLLKLMPDVPVEIALTCADGINVVSPRGTPAVKYTLLDGRTFFATQYVAAKFKQLKVEPLERIALCMRNIDGKSITSVERVPTVKLEPAPESSTPSPGGLNDQATQPLKELGNESANGRHTPSLDTPVPDAPLSGDPGPTDPERMNQDQTPPPPLISQLERALKTAILAAHSAEQYGNEIGYAIRFDQESVKSMAVTVLIGMQGGRY